MPSAKRVKTRAGYFALRCLSFVCRVGSHRFLCGLGSFLGDLLYVGSARLRRTALSNLSLALSAHMSEADIRQLCRSSFRVFSKDVVEFLSSSHVTREELRRRVELRGEEFLRSALKGGKGVILLSAHFGNWEWMAARISADGIPVSFVRRLDSDPATEALIDSAQRHNNIKIIPKHDVRAALRSLRDNEVLLMLADQNAGSAGIRVPFFGCPASTFPGVAALAIRTGTPVIPGFAVRKPDDNHVVTFYPALQQLPGKDNQEKIRANTVLYTKVIEDQIRRHPDHWIWFLRRWRS
jgi:KDO2-lipid IV(A) lauroyltransferase